jgi:stage V sporulation protein SpoVS
VISIDLSAGAMVAVLTARTKFEGKALGDIAVDQVCIEDAQILPIWI